MDTDNHNFIFKTYKVTILMLVFGWIQVATAMSV